MPFDLIPRGFFASPRNLTSIFDDEDDIWTIPNATSGLTISEDQASVFVEAAMPGLSAQDIEVTIDKGWLWIRGDKTESQEDKQKKFYRRATSSFSYRVAIPSNVDENQEPGARYKNGVMTVTFHKLAGAPARKLDVKTE